jgi:dTDP-glucose pyrophosphorylase
MKPALLILAAGIGSRYGGVKQMDALGPGGESIIDYSVYDAIRAGFGKIVFVINKKIEKDFREIWEPKLENKIDHAFVIQDPDDLPEGFSLPENRVKPWGTGQAVLAARNEISTPFAVINADDFYGRGAYSLIYNYLSAQSGDGQYCMVGYLLSNTLSEHGTVSRGVCSFDDDDHLSLITEITAIGKRGDVIGYESVDESFNSLDENARISMNIWGFRTRVFQYLMDDFAEFLKTNKDNPKAEFLLPSVINDLVESDRVSVKMLKTDFEWFGVTYKEDKGKTIDRISQMVSNGEYPLYLWER